MLDQIIHLVKEQAIGQFAQQTNIPNEKAEKAAQLAGESVVESLEKEAKAGNASGLIELFSGQIDLKQLANNDIVKGMMESLMGKLETKGDVPPETAKNAAQGVLPSLIQTVIEKFMSPDKKDATFDLNGLLQTAVESVVENKAKEMLGDNFGSTIGKMLGGFFGKK